MQKNLGGTNYIGGRGEIPKTKSEDNILVFSLMKALKTALNFASENLVNWKIFLFQFFFSSRTLRNAYKFRRLKLFLTLVIEYFI